jgi:predicted component of type VI protein secretion system
MGVKATEEETTIAEIDETLGYINTMLKTDEFGNRMDWRKRSMLLDSLDDLLDVRLALMKVDKSKIML